MDSIPLLIGSISDTMLNSVHSSVVVLNSLFDIYRDFILLKFPYPTLIIPGSNAIASSMRVRGMQKDKYLYWVHSLFLVIFTGFAGGCLGPMLIGKPPVIIANDIVVPLCVLFWYITHYIPYVYDMLLFTPIQVVWTVLSMLFRTHAICNTLALSFTVLKAGIWYPIPLTGPIVVGTTVGSFGMFMPLDKGFTPIMNGMPWAMQGAFYTSVFYHLMVNDISGPFGKYLRLLIGTYSEEMCRVIIASMWISTGLLQMAFGPDANLFTPLHKVFYLVFQVTGPPVIQKAGTVGWDIHIRKSLGRFVSVSRYLVVIAAVALHLYTTAPPVSLTAPMSVPLSFTANQTLIGSCSLFSSLRGCTPLRLVTPVFSSPLPALQVVQSTSSAASVWSLPVPNVPTATTSDSQLSFRLGVDGVIRIVLTVGKEESAVWASKSSCALNVVDSIVPKPILRLNETTGVPYVLCGNGELIPVVA